MYSFSVAKLLCARRQARAVTIIAVRLMYSDFTSPRGRSNTRRTHDCRVSTSKSGVINLLSSCSELMARDETVIELPVESQRQSREATLDAVV